VLRVLDERIATDGDDEGFHKENQVGEI
jgi:hypothetical protein